MRIEGARELGMDVDRPDQVEPNNAPVTSGTWQRPIQQGFHWTIGRKLVAVVSIAITACFAITVALQASMQRANLYAVNEDNNRIVSTLLASELSGAVQCK